ESFALLEKYKIPIAKYEIIRNASELKKAIARVGFPLAMKIVAEKAVHKTELNGIKLNISSIEEAEKAFNELKKIKECKAVMLQEMVNGVELIIGSKQDVQFGQTILFGFGGVFVELLKDYAIRIIPITKADVEEMINELKAKQLLFGYRNIEPINMEKLKETILKASRMVESEKIKELDINPLIANSKEVKAVDVRIVK
ncbi:MAG: acetate--CoA ligase family protein, partial [Candidatus Diapherotrites archaeon]|nr:acetate--CoA ligase family protein [Candidatus Diapherotrites archaeon]